MFFEIFKFELRYRQKRPATYIYFFIMFLISFLAISTDAVQIGGGAGLVKENAPATIATMMIIISAFFMMISSAVMGVAVLRDFDHQTESMMFVNPISKFDYLGGRFLGSLVVLIFIYIGSLLGFVLGEFMPWRDADKLLAFNFWNYLQPFLYFVIPNLFFTGVLFFFTGALTRKMMVVYTQWIFLFVFYQIALILTQEVDNRSLAAIMDPFALSTINVATQYWTVTEQNSQVIPIEGFVLWNRLLWLGIGVIFMVAGYFAFSFNVVRNSFFKKKKIAEESASQTHIEVPTVERSFGLATQLRQVWRQSVFYFGQIFKGFTFQSIVLFGVAILIINSFFMGRVFGINTYPTTYQMVQLISGFNLFFLIILVFYSGELIWKEREVKINLIYDAMPIPDFINLVSKFFGLIMTFVVLLFALIVMGVLIQSFKGFFVYDLSVYFSSLYTNTLFFLILFTLLAFFIQVMVNNKFLGYALIIIFFITRAILQNWGVEHRMFNFGSASLGTYSDMNGYGHFIPGFSWFNVYWLGLSILLFGMAVIFSVRGSEALMKTRLAVGRLRLTRPIVTLIIASFSVFALSGCYIYYNTNVVNEYQNSDDQNADRADYERDLKQYQYMAQPKITEVNLKVDIYPAVRDYKAEGVFTLENQSEESISEIHIQLNADPQISYDDVRFSKQAVIKENLTKHKYLIYELAKPLQPGDKIDFEFKTSFHTAGFVESNPTNTVVYNGTFFNSGVFPSIGYSEGFELATDDDRKDNDLEPKERALKRDDPKGLYDGMLGDDSRGILFEIQISTDSDQIAIAPGYLQKEWEENGRKYYHYKMDIPMANFYNIISARYEVKRDQMMIMDDSVEKQIDLEIYYHQGHEYNLDRMMKSMKNSFTYFSKVFTPYQYRQMRILEFPRYSTFAQSFANTVPFSEGIGFMLEIKDEADVDIAYFVTAHEMAHQWWAHQVLPANVQGSTMIVESLAEYSALMLMKSEFSTENMQEFLKEDMNRYLSGRASEQKKELPLVKVENQQYIHYGKGGVNMYAFQDYIGEDSVNMALSRFCKKWRDFETNGRFSTTHDLIAEFRKVTPDSLQHVVTDLFEKIVLFENKTEEVVFSKSENESYLVELSISAKKFEADSMGMSQEVALADWVDIGVYGEDQEGNDKLLYLKKHKITDKEMTFTIAVDELPTKAGIDPINKLIDRNPDDNVKTASEKEAS